MFQGYNSRLLRTSAGNAGALSSVRKDIQWSLYFYPFLYGRTSRRYDNVLTPSGKSRDGGMKPGGGTPGGGIGGGPCPFADGGGLAESIAIASAP